MPQIDVPVAIACVFSYEGVHLLKQCWLDTVLLFGFLTPQGCQTRGQGLQST